MSLFRLSNYELGKGAFDKSKNVEKCRKMSKRVGTRGGCHMNATPNFLEEICYEKNVINLEHNNKRKGKKNT